MSEMDRYTRKLLSKLGRLGAERVTLAAQLVKLQDEVDEVTEAAAPPPGEADLEGILAELVDIVIVCHTAAFILGYGSEELMGRVLAKAEVNARREWYRTASGTARHTPEEV